ncbi:MAG: ElyC/SanA/YdcF family protein [Campylobacterota bacterium]|nr:ElyC/SanA/YdcF family protein [Campylobacterota bacterium]
MGFYLKKFIAFFIEPFGLILILSIIALFFLFTKKYNLAKIFISLSILLTLLFSNSQFSNFIIKNLEIKYPKYEYNQRITYIHVLGAGNKKNSIQPISSHINSTGTKRVLEGIIIYKKTPNSKLIFTGYSNIPNAPQTANVYAELAISLGVKKEDIIKGFKTKDTQEEAEFTKKIVENKKFLLVTSASHMPRAMLIFRSIGLNPIPAPTDFHLFTYKSYLTPIKSMSVSQIAIHEYIGILWSNITTLIYNFKQN